MLTRKSRPSARNIYKYKHATLNATLTRKTKIHKKSAKICWLDVFKQIYLTKNNNKIPPRSHFKHNTHTYFSRYMYIIFFSFMRKQFKMKILRHLLKNHLLHSIRQLLLIHSFLLLQNLLKSINICQNEFTASYFTQKCQRSKRIHSESYFIVAYLRLWISNFQYMYMCAVHVLIELIHKIWHQIRISRCLEPLNTSSPQNFRTINCLIDVFIV